MIKFATSKQDIEIESKIGDRAITMAKKLGVKYDKLTALMDIDACHNNGNPLRLTDLLNADDTNFTHDVFGIRANINRTTGKLDNCFVPRYSI